MPGLILPKSYDIRNPQADRAVDFINGLTHTKGKHAKQPFLLRPWQELQIVRPIFGLLNDDGTRLIREAYMEIPRKNGKSEIAAAIALKLLCADGEEGGEVYSAAADRGQASLVFNVAAQMVRNDPELSYRCKIVDSQKRIVYKPTQSFYMALSSDADTKHGFNASGVIYDEIHTARSRELWDVLTTSMSTREQPLIFGITTAGFDRSSLCWELHEYAEKVRDGIVDDPKFLPILYSAPDDVDIYDEKIWQAVNPALGDFRKIDEMRAAAEKAKLIPARENTFRQLYLCQWTKNASQWLPSDLWAKGAFDIDLEKLAGRICFVGVDLATTTDIAAVAFLFPNGDSTYTALFRFYVPELFEQNPNIPDRNKALYRQWINQGALIATPGNVIDDVWIENEIVEWSKKYWVKEIPIDRWNSTSLQTRLMGHGLTVVPFGQGFASMSAPTKEIETLLIAGKLFHDNNPVMTWMQSNAAVEKDPAGNLKLSKKVSSEKIDGMVALAMALGRAMVSGNDGSMLAEVW